MRQAVMALLKALGFALSAGDMPLIDMAIQRAQRRITNDCNLSLVPEGLRTVAVSMAAGMFLLMYKAVGRMADAGRGIDLSAPVASIKEGDTSVSYAVGSASGSKTPEQRLDELIASLVEGHDTELSRYRRMRRWKKQEPLSDPCGLEDAPFTMM